MGKKVFKQYLEKIGELRFSDHKAEMTLAKQMVSDGKKTNDVRLLLFGRYYTLDAMYRMGEFDDGALKMAGKLLKDAEKNEIYEIVCRCHNLIGIHFAAEGDDIAAIEHYQIAEAFAIRHRYTPIIRFLTNNMGDLYLRMNDYRSAYDSFKRCVASTRKLVDEGKITGKEAEYSTCIALINVAETLFYLRKYSECEIYLEELLTKIVESDPYGLTPSIMSLYALCFIETGKEGLADTYTQNALKSIEEPADYSESFVHLLLLCNQLIQKDYLKKYAPAMIDGIREIALKSGYINHICGYYEVAIKYEQSMGNSERLLSLYKEYFEHKKIQDESLIYQQRRAVRSRKELNATIRRQNMIEEKNKRLTNLSMHDPLTGLYNRYMINNVCEPYCSMAREKMLNTGIIIMDVDYFKDYNDNYGHLNGDGVLKLVSEALKNAKLSDELIIRYGGDEFLVFFKNATIDRIIAFSKRVNENLRKYRIEHAKSAVSEYVTVSQGIANGVPDAGESMLDLIHLADNALYKAKAEKRGSIGIYYGIDNYKVLKDE